MFPDHQSLTVPLVGVLRTVEQAPRGKERFLDEPELLRDKIFDLEDKQTWSNTSSVTRIRLHIIRMVAAHIQAINNNNDDLKHTPRS